MFGVAGLFVGTGVFVDAGVFTGTGVVTGVELFATAGIMAPELAPRFWQGEAATETISARHAIAFTAFTGTAMEKSKERQGLESRRKRSKSQNQNDRRNTNDGRLRQTRRRKQKGKGIINKSWTERRNIVEARLRVYDMPCPH